LKIVYITASFPFGTGESFLIPEIDALNLAGHNLIIIPIFPRGSLRNDWENIPANNKVVPEYLISGKILLHFLIKLISNPISLFKVLQLLKGSTSKQLIKNLSIFPKSVWLSHLIKHEGPDHIHAHWGNITATMAMLASEIASIPWSFTCHRWDIYENNLLSKKSESAMMVRFISNRGKNDSLLFKLNPDKLVVIPMGTTIPDKYCIPNWKNDGKEFIIICPANLIPVKGHIYLIEAIEILINEGYYIKLLLAGEGILKNELLSTIKIKKLEKYIIFLGQLPHPELIKLYLNSKVHLVILPSIDLGNGEHEGIPVSLMEAMSFGVPVISTNTGSINELLPIEYNLTVQEKNAIEIVYKIQQIYNSPLEYERMAMLCRKLIEEQWDIASSIKKLISMIYLK
jgi:glycosyltransferase involved in cell wall biosynthesis